MRFPPRSQHVAASFGGSLWVIGGSTDAVLYDIWASADGASWTQVTASASFGRRIDSAIAAHDDNKLYLVNGNLTRNGGEGVGFFGWRQLGACAQFGDAVFADERRRTRFL